MRSRYGRTGLARNRLTIGREAVRRCGPKPGGRRWGKMQSCRPAAPAQRCPGPVEHRYFHDIVRTQQEGSGLGRELSRGRSRMRALIVELSLERLLVDHIFARGADSKQGDPSLI